MGEPSPERIQHQPDLAHNGKRLAMSQYLEGINDVVIVIDTDKQTPIQISQEGGNGNHAKRAHDDKLILANTNNGNIVFDAKTKNVVELISPNLPVYAATWIDNDVVSFNTYNKGKWLMYHYNTTTNKKQPIENSQWSMMLTNSQQTIKFDQDLIAFIDSKKIPANDLCSYSLSRYRLTFRLDGGNLYCQTRDNNDILKWNKQGKLTRLKSELNPGESFSVSQDKMVISLLKDTSSDVIRTNF